MAKTALVMMADEDYPEGRGRMATLLSTAVDLGDEAEIYFHGAGVNWMKTFAAGEHPFTHAYGERFKEAQKYIAGACNFCTNVRFEAGEAAASLGIPILGDDGEHHSLADLIRAGTTVITL